MNYLLRGGGEVYILHNKIINGSSTDQAHDVNTYL